VLILEVDDPLLNLERQLVGVAIGPARAVGHPFEN
jgi:hypothetical protein